MSTQVLDLRGRSYTSVSNDIWPFHKMPSLCLHLIRSQKMTEVVKLPSGLSRKQKSLVFQSEWSG